MSGRKTPFLRMMFPLTTFLLLAGCRASDGRGGAEPATPSTTAPAAAATPAPASPATTGMGGAPPASIPAPAATVQQPAPASADGASREYAGWYMRQGGVARFQPCGKEETWPIGQGADLAERARGFTLQEGDPIYVRVVGTRRGGALDVVSVAQFGSPTPVRDCAMNGVVTPPPR